MMRQTALRIICNFYQQVERQDLGDYGKGEASAFLRGTSCACHTHSIQEPSEPNTDSVNVISKKLHLWFAFHCVAKTDLSTSTEKSCKRPDSRL